MIIGITGTLGAGKGTVVEYLKQKGFAHFSASGKLREILEDRGVPVNREAYSKLADEIRTADPQGLVKLLWTDLESSSEQGAVIEALHDVGEMEFVRSRGGIILGVDADIKTRYERIAHRGSEKDDVTFEEFKQIATHEEEGGGKHNIRAVLDQADYVIQNTNTPEELWAEVDIFLEKYGND